MNELQVQVVLLVVGILGTYIGWGLHRIADAINQTNYQSRHSRT